MALDRGGSTPLWRQLQRELLTRMEAGEFTDRFPGELALVEHYGVSRHTVRQALSGLRADGVVVAERGRRPRVAAPPEIQQPMGALYSLFASVEASGLAQRSVVRRLDVRADAVVAERLDLEGSAPLVYLERLRLAGGVPLALDRVWLPADLAAPLVSADFTHTSLYAELRERAGVRLDRGREDVHAVVPTAAERGWLECPVGAAAFSINRLGFAEGRAVEWRHTVVRGDRFALTADFSAHAGYQLVGSSR
ncbi:GntR family transcriptional regulator [Umezawaea endophytica]|uniref:GntR family transcriptional regulator n=1 Tax=Umezawaea endophytica TaxID=1654476 RepID=A0A9X2VMB4_9PSEU|nr:GntR family transcriptional regulator [Umezawaea endophytica]MCS7479044.1 GntR family transcriptional regulator [Umezawaea endophytica]